MSDQQGWRSIGCCVSALVIVIGVSQCKTPLERAASRLCAAAAVEGFVSPSHLPGWTKADLEAILGLAYLLYLLAAPAPKSADSSQQWI